MCTLSTISAFTPIWLWCNEVNSTCIQHIIWDKGFCQTSESGNQTFSCFLSQNFHWSISSSPFITSKNEHQTTYLKGSQRKHIHDNICIGSQTVLWDFNQKHDKKIKNDIKNNYFFYDIEISYLDLFENIFSNKHEGLYISVNSRLWFE